MNTAMQRIWGRSVRVLVRNVRSYYTVDSSNVKKEDFSLARHIQMKIRATGPITVANYMKEVLTNPAAGYYMHKDVFGESGDFITSPELSQIFGELVAIWFLNEWSKVGCPKPVQIVELGPGRGTLSQDMLRVFDHFNLLKGASLNLVEVSPTLSDIQSKNLCIQNRLVHDDSSPFYREGISHQGIPVKWYRDFSLLPDVFTLLVAHEFFDALPIHKFHKTEVGYREVLIDIGGDGESKNADGSGGVKGADVADRRGDQTQIPEDSNSFRYVIAREETPMQKLFINPKETREHLEISPESLVLVKSIAKKLEEYGGLALIADYGHDGESKDSFRAFRKHKLHDPLVEPGSADLTADVDFQALKEAATSDNDVLSYGPIAQRQFLKAMGIEHRLKKLLESATEDQKKGLQYAYDIMTSPTEMGDRFKVMALVPGVIKSLLEKYPPAGFN